MLRRCTAITSRVGSGSCAGTATSSVAERLTAQPGDQGDAEPGAHQRQVGVELHRGVRDPGQPPGAGVHPGQPLAADGALGGGDPALVDQVARADPGAAGERVVERDDDVGDVVGDLGGLRGGRGW